MPQINWHRTSKIPILSLAGSPLKIRMTDAVVAALFGPARTGTPEHKAWEAARERRRQELGGECGGADMWSTSIRLGMPRNNDFRLVGRCAPLSARAQRAEAMDAIPVQPPPPMSC
jgi:hypothetical protein